MKQNKTSKMRLVISLIFILVGLNHSNAQEVSCNDLQEFIEQNGFRQASIDSYSLDSSWLYKVTAYSYEYKTYVIAEIKVNEYSFNTRSYVFCGIPSFNWSSFQIGGYGDSESYGQRFHKYIMDYKCNCY